MSFNIRQIRYFVAAAEAGKIVAAASAVGISPSAITEAIQELEEATGTRLVTRHRDGIKVTYDGYVFLQHGRNMPSAGTGPRSRAGSPSASPSPWPAISSPPPWRASDGVSRMSTS